MENFPFSSSILLWCIWTRITVLNSRSCKVRCKGFKFSFIILEAFDRTIRLIFYQSFKLKKHRRHLEKLSTKMRKYLAPVVERVGSGPYKSAWINSSKWEALDVYGVNYYYYKKCYNKHEFVLKLVQLGGLVIDVI